MPQKILIVVGTRPNFIKVTQFRKELGRYPGEFEFKLLHTGQHYDGGMSDVFFRQLDIPEPDFYLNVGNTGSAGEQIGQIISGLAQVISLWKPSMVMVVGDVNSTLAGAIAANKAGITLAHVEAGLRSNDRTMPEEINRILTDELADILFTTEESGTQNLLAEGKSPGQIHFVGNTMIDTLVAFDASIASSSALKQLGLRPKEFALMTMHRPANVDDAANLQKLAGLIAMIAEKYQVVFPIHPRTRNRIQSFGLEDQFAEIKGLHLCDPLDYLSFQKLTSECAFVITDSGGIQEETTFRQVPCITLRNSTERPVTVTLGTNELLPFELETVRARINEIAAGKSKPGVIPPLWDGKATARIVEVLRGLVKK